MRSQRGSEFGNLSGIGFQLCDQRPAVDTDADCAHQLTKAADGDALGICCTLRPRRESADASSRLEPDIMPRTPPVPPAPEFRELVCHAFEREFATSGLSADTEAADRLRLDAAARLSEKVLVGMPTWFGNAGTHALASRALARVQEEQKVLSAMTLISGRAELRGHETAAHTDGASATAEGLLAFLEAFAAGLGRLVGSTLTARLFEVCALSDAQAAPVPTTLLSPPRHTTDD